MTNIVNEYPSTKQIQFEDLVRGDVFKTINGSTSHIYMKTSGPYDQPIGVNLTTGVICDRFFSHYSLVEPLPSVTITKTKDAIS